jgi:hypothetical protein
MNCRAAGANAARRLDDIFTLAGFDDARKQHHVAQ